MKDNLTVYRGNRIETKVRGNPGITQIWVWNSTKKRYVDPRNLVDLKQKHFRAIKRVKVLGKRRKFAATFNSLEEARMWRNSVEAISEVKGNQSSFYLVRDVISDWREWSKPPCIALSTWEIYGQVMIHLTPLHEIAVEELRAEDIDAWLKLLKSPQYPKPKSRYCFLREVTTLSTILKWYREYKNPRYQHPVLQRHRKDSYFQKKPVQKMPVLSENEVEQFLDRLRSFHKPVYFYLAAFQVFSGARIGEACGLHWESVDLENGRVEIKQICTWRHQTKTPYLKEGTKTGEVRTIALPERLISLLQEWRRMDGSQSLVFHSEGSLMHYNAIQSAYNKAFRALGFPQRSTHILRHTFATIHANQTKDIRATQAAMGHRDLRVTQHYACVGEQTQRNALSDFTFGKNQPKNNETPPSGSNIIELWKKKIA